MKEKIHCRLSSSNFRRDFPTKYKQAIQKTLLIMKIVIVIVFVFSLHVSANTMGQIVSLKKQDITLKEALRELRLQTGYYFIYNSKEVPDKEHISVNFVKTPLEEALASMLKKFSLEYSIEDKVISLKPADISLNVAPNPTNAQQQQTRAISGKVIDVGDAGILVGVSVKVKGTTNGTITNQDGLFQLNVKSTDKTLVFSLMGYITQEVPITALIKYDVSLAQDTKQLETVVIAFGTSTKAELTNSVATVSAKDIEQRPISNLTSAIVGVAPGVQTTAGSGQPGEGLDVRIRGFTSVTNDNSPLYIVDGAPFEGVLSNINPDDIESISILKDASATSLYGARAANGVVLITTKRGGKNDKTPITARVSTALSTRGLPRYEVLDAYQYFPVAWEILKNSNGNSTTYATQNLADFIGWNPFNVSNDEIVYQDGRLNPNAKLLYPDDTGFGDDLHRLGIRTDAGLTTSGGNAKSDYYVSFNYLNDQGYILGSDFQRVTGRLRVNATPLSWLKVGLNISANFTKSDRANQSSGLGENPFYIDLTMAPIYPVYKHDPVTGAYLLDAQGNKIYDPGDYKPVFTGRNVIYETLNNITQQKRNSFTAVNTMEAKISKTLKFVSNFSIYANNYRGEEYDNSAMGDAMGTGRNFRTNSTQYYLNWSKILTWTKRFNKHRFNVLAGHENYYNYWDQLWGRGYGETIEGVTALDNFTSTRSDGYDRLYTTQGFLSKFDYSYNSIYVFSASARRDGSSRFSGKNKWGNFWSVSGAYNIDKEDYFKVKWIDQLKIRASHGLVGNDKTGNYFTSRMLYTLDYDNGNEGGAFLTQTGNPDLKWETNTNSDIAVEIATLKNRLSATVEVFRRQSNNLLFDTRIPVTSGLLTMDENFGSMRNQGIELQIQGTPIKTKNFSWLADFNITKFKNVILSLPPRYEGVVIGTKKYEVGHSRYEFWLRDQAPVLTPTTGGILYYPKEGTTPNYTVDGVDYTSSADGALRRYFGSSIPDFYGSIGSTLSYKSWSLRLMGVYQIGGYTYDNDYQRLMVRGTAGRAMHIDQLKSWKNPGDITNVPRLRTGQSSYNSNFYLTPADYFNFRMASLTYNLPKRFLSRIKVTSAKAFVNGENLFITSQRKGMDPTQSYTGVASYSYAPARIISMGLNLTL
ncbi:SusC/RagA family TonB-linked outer membrane protein [Pedobacter sp. UBA4863]|uniref:SusC/RagA family TonB-linked outer membrane protein n=1 Tax=Pedobacter sp. UBA4863 TaxID=1947060 RepID=UPI0025DD2A84|nr:SusC/RagA family TonB-linked outer membrane protein [Pedobacter sp. UBA4863]